MMTNYKSQYSKFLEATNKQGSNKAKSYLRALDLLSEILKSEPLRFKDCINIWEVDSLNSLTDLYQEAKSQALKGKDSTWNITGIPPSYLQDRFISAALASYIKFHNEKSFENTDINEAFPAKKKSTQGFLNDPVKKEFIEKYAMNVAREYYEENGYLVEDVSDKRSLGYDFRCKKENTTLEVEVKGTTSNGEKIILTRNEVLNAKTSMNICILFIVHSIEISELKGNLTANSSKTKILNDWNPLDKHLEPLSYHYKVLQGTPK
jgi:hypothetical protein